MGIPFRGRVRVEDRKQEREMRTEKKTGREKHKRWSVGIGVREERDEKK